MSFKKTIVTKVVHINRRVLVWLRGVELPGFRGMGLYDVLKFFFTGLGDPKFSLMAAAMAFNFFFSLFPTIILLLIVISFFPLPVLEENIKNLIDQVMPAGMGLDPMAMAQGIVNDLFKKDGNKLGIILLTAFLALRGGTKGIIAMTRAFTKNKEVFVRRNLIQTYGTALAIFFVLGGLLLLSIGVTVTGEVMIGYLARANFISSGLDSFLLNTLNYFISLLLLIFSISSIYFLAPATQQRWKFITPGSLLASILTLLTIIGFSWFFSNFGNFNRLYGSLAAIILLMLWFYYISMVLLVGFELNAAIDIASYHHHKQLAKRKSLVFKSTVSDVSVYEEKEPPPPPSSPEEVPLAIPEDAEVVEKRIDPPIED